MHQQDIRKFITAKRREKNLTQEQPAEKLGVSNKTVSKWENRR
ncbi:MAG: helix-turn-helix transcriptional regulator [Clostridiales bacterium]|nr:helix-turn-helix transcriptional regulator [Clostridiales bacterium]